MPGRPALLVGYLTATLAAFGGIYLWALPLIVIGAFVLAFASRGRTAAPSDTRALDWAIAVLLVAIAMQLFPLPAAVRTLLSPHLADAERALRPDAGLRGTSSGPLSLDADATGAALALAASVALTYRAARGIFGTGGVRQVCWALSVIGTIAAIGAMVQRALTPGLIYGFWPPQDAGGQPFGPVVNRNHFAAWLLMASALTAGYLIARVSRRAHEVGGWRSLRRIVVSIAQSTVAFTAAAWLTITITVVAAQSRSALAGLGVATVTLMRSVTHTWKPVLVALATLFVFAVAMLAAGESTATRLANRFADTLEVREIDRIAIWRETLPMVSDFALTGVGAGAFGRAMLTYQQTRIFAPHLGMEWHFNHAHNHYLQLAAEGGLLVTLPLVAVIVLFVRIVARRLREDRGELRAVRLGALAGLAGVATQSLWEVPLTMPAAALLAATLAALATHHRGSHEQRHSAE